ncbi:hypothetical protein [Luteimonas deserti]|uniref:DUF998 domain-containing protein n=1 Tax=Luteimonas deserti TaxID=2752306 RepID=A0A7Z0QQ71_9GAMM|nr:hypothetical protein [Luteimonas deserti]NYZ62174.1 hypothetical protein [Luteimonas deserti]
MRSMGARLHGPTWASGFGLLMWCGMTTALLNLRPAGTALVQHVQALGLTVGLALATLGWVLARRSPVDPLRQTAGRPMRPVGRAAAGGAMLSGLALLTLLAGAAQGRNAGLLVALALVLLVLAFAAMALVAGREATALSRPLRLPIGVLFSMSLGLALLYLGMDRLLAAGHDGRLMLATLFGLGVALAACQALDWHGVPSAPPDGRRRRQQVALVALLVGAPALCWLLAGTGLLPAAVWLVLVFVCVLAAAVIDAMLLECPPAGPGTATGAPSTTAST